jgi:ribose transport system ATP-binding protein
LKSIFARRILDIPTRPYTHLDESTRALSGADLEHIHQLLRRIAADGSSALMVSHSLSELMAVTDRTTVLRDGRVAGGGLPTSGLSEQELARRMLGSSVEAVTPRAAAEPEGAAAGGPGGSNGPADPAVTVTGLSGAHLSGAHLSGAHLSGAHLSGVSFTVARARSSASPGCRAAAMRTSPTW